MTAEQELERWKAMAEALGEALLSYHILIEALQAELRRLRDDA